MPYIDICEHLYWFTFIEKGEDNIDKFLNKGCSDEEIKQVAFSGTIQKQIGCPPDQEFEQIVSTKSLKICPITVNDIANASSILDLHNCDSFNSYQPVGPYMNHFFRKVQ